MPANVRSALLLAIGVLLLGGVAAVLVHDDGASTTPAASRSSTTVESPGTTGASSPPSTSASTSGGGGNSSSTTTTGGAGSFPGTPPSTELARGTNDDVLASTGRGAPVAAVLVLLGLAAGARAAALATRPR